MPVSEEERKQYVAFVEEQIKMLKCLDVNTEDIVWHYTTGDALLSIVESGTIYATQVSCLNDSSEVRYGEGLLRDAFLRLQAGDALPQEEAQFLERIVKEAVEQSAVPHRPFDWFVTCFSREKDDLSQWRAYSGGENGIAIGFHAGAFFGRSSVVVRLNYAKDEHLTVAQNIAAATLRFFREGRDARSPVEGHDWPEEFLREWNIWVSQLAPMVKDAAFRGENEYRIIHHFQGHELGKLRFRHKPNLMSLHLPLVFPPPNSATHSTLLPIMEVMVGPGRHKDISRMTVELFMRQKGYYNVPVTVSTIPFQTT